MSMERSFEINGLTVSAWPSTTVPGGIYVELSTAGMGEDTPLLIYMNDGQVWTGTSGGYEIEYLDAPGSPED